MSVNTIRNKSMYFESFYNEKNIFVKTVQNSVIQFLLKVKHSKNCKARMEGRNKLTEKKNLGGSVFTNMVLTMRKDEP